MTDWRFLVNKYVRNQTLGIPFSHEPPVNEVFEKTHGGCLIDVGANAGIYSIRFRRHFHHVYAIEPDPRMIRQLGIRKYLHLAFNVTVLRFAASDRNGEAILFVDGPMGRSSGSADTIEPYFTYRPASNPALTVTYSPNDPREGIHVKTMMLDAYPFPRNIELVKIDVEGAEFRVLDGAWNTLTRAKKLIVELHDRERKDELSKMVNAEFDIVRWLDPDHIYGEHF